MIRILSYGGGVQSECVARIQRLFGRKESGMMPKKVILAETGDTVEYACNVRKIPHMNPEN